MVIYHILSYFTTAGYSGTGYVRFVTGSFIFISGYIVAVFYEKKFEIEKRKVCIRLIYRGLKLITIFTLLNVAINLIGMQSHKVSKFNIYTFIDNVKDIYVQGNSNYAVFQILVPIAYLLILSPVILYLRNWKKTISIIVIGILLMYIILKINIFNLYGLMIGFAGMTVGLFSVYFESYQVKSKVLIGAIFFVTIIFMKYFDRNIISYIFAIMVILKLVYDFSKTQDSNKRSHQILLILGKYSLLAYIIQIIIMQFIYQVFVKHRSSVDFRILMYFLLITFILIIFFLVLDFIRKRMLIVDKLYKIAFQ